MGLEHLQLCVVIKLLNLISVFLQAKSKQAVPLGGDAKRYKRLMDGEAVLEPAPSYHR